MSPRNPFTGSGREVEGGVGATRKQDFNSHVEGGGFRHTASSINATPPTGFNGTTVQTVLEELKTAIQSNGSGFISIGSLDGYATGNYNVNSPQYTTFKQAFNAAVADPRLANGGVVFVLPGTYYVTEKITVPAGISIMGDSAGTLLIGTAIEQSMFLVKKGTKDTRIGGNSGAGTQLIDSGSNVEMCRFYNLMLADNLYGTVNAGAPCMVTVPMVEVEPAATAIFERVSFIGKLANGSTLERVKTSKAISVVSGGTTGTNLSVVDCFMDGLRIGLEFNPSLGSADTLVVERCKARIFGFENTASTNSNLDCFVAMTACNARINNNSVNLVGASSQYFCVINSSSGNTDDVRISLTGNIGRPQIDVLQPATSTDRRPRFVRNQSGLTLRIASYGNTWGNAYGATWQIVVGGGAGFSEARPSTVLGDINGVNAINIVLAMATYNNEPIECIVNYGTYNVNNVGASFLNQSNISFIGKKRGADYPVFKLEFTADATLDGLSQRYLSIAGKLKSIKFDSTGGTATRSIALCWGVSYDNPHVNNQLRSAYFSHVEDCIFINTSLAITPIATSIFTDQDGNPVFLSTLVENCQFLQNGAFPDTISLTSPSTNLVHIKNCLFHGNGYALNIGTQSAVSNIENCQYIVDGCTFDSTGYTISTVAPGGYSNSYVALIDTGKAKITIKDTQILPNNRFTGAENFAGTTATGSLGYIRLTGDEINIINTTIVGIDQLNTATSVLATVRAAPSTSMTVSGSKFIGGALPLQIHATGTFANASLIGHGGININNNYFRNHSSSNSTAMTTSVVGKGYTLLDIDLNLATSVAYTNTPTVNISNNTFHSLISNTVVSAGVADTPYQVAHASAGGYYSAVGVVQVYAKNCAVNFSNNAVHANKIFTLVGSPASYIHYSAVVIQTLSSANGSQARQGLANVSGNHIMAQSSYTSAASGNSASALWVSASYATIYGNLVSLRNTLGVAPSSAHFIGSLWLATTSLGGSYSTTVTNNLFSRRDFAGTAGTGATTGNALGYIYISSVSNPGLISNNSFSDPTIDGTLTTMVSDNTTAANKWLIENNKNQTDIKSIINPELEFSVQEGGVLYEYAGSHEAITSSVTSGDETGLTFNLINTDPANDIFFSAVLSGFNTLPYGVQITSISFDYSYNVTPNTSKVARIDVFGATSSGSTGNIVQGTTGTITLSSFTGTPKNTPTERLAIQMRVTNRDTLASTVCTISNFKVTYRY